MKNANLIKSLALLSTTLFFNTQAWLVQPANQRMGTLTFEGAGIDGQEVRVIFTSERYTNNFKLLGHSLVPSYAVIESIADIIEQRKLPMNEMRIELKLNFFEAYDSAIREFLIRRNNRQKNGNAIKYERISLGIDHDHEDGHWILPCDRTMQAE